MEEKKISKHSSMCDSLSLCVCRNSAWCIIQCHHHHHHIIFFLFIWVELFTFKSQFKFSFMKHKRKYVGMEREKSRSVGITIFWNGIWLKSVIQRYRYIRKVGIYFHSIIQFHNIYSHCWILEGYLIVSYMHKSLDFQCKGSLSSYILYYL